MLCGKLSLKEKKIKNILNQLTEKNEMNNNTSIILNLSHFNDQQIRSFLANTGICKRGFFLMRNFYLELLLTRFTRGTTNSTHCSICSPTEYELTHQI